MPAFPDRESSLLNKLYETAPWTAKLHQQDQVAESCATSETMEAPLPPVVNGATEPVLIGLPVDTLISTSKNMWVVVVKDLIDVHSSESIVHRESLYIGVLSECVSTL